MKNGPITGQVITPEALSSTDQETWHRFLAPRPLAFLSYAYARAVASCVPSVLICRLVQDGRTVAFFPFQYRSVVHAVAGIGERLGGELSDYFGLVAEPGFRIEARALLRLSGLKSFYFTHLDESQQENGLVGEKSEVGCRIDFPQGGETFWEEKGRSDKKFTSDTERRERKLIREYGPVRFVFCEDDVERSLGKLIADKRAQYHRTGVGDVLSEKRTQDILYALCRTRDEQCSGIVSTLHAGDTWVASHFGLRSGSTLHYWFPVYNPALKSFAPGRMLLKQIIHSAQSQGLERIDRGAGDSVAKRDFATSQHFFYTGLWQRPGVTALVHRAGLAVGWRMDRYRRSGKMDME
ncbi:MAG TPA: GNAT family N-acetyltransferase [Rhizomicrobium sp.]|nr:GNAT family N-acetyltransferase [Rhizomicrobium sp.]